MNAKLTQTVIDLHGDRGRAWLDNLPNIIAMLEERWSLEVSLPFDELSYHYVAPALHADGTRRVLKLGVPNDEMYSEVNALRTYDGLGIARLLDADLEQGALLLESCWPGNMLSAVNDDEEATLIATQVMAQLWCPAPPEHDFKTAHYLAEGLQRMRHHFDGGTGPLPTLLVEKAECLFTELLDSAGPPMLLHGDFHHYNILRAEREPWLAIDPKGVVGEPAFDVAAFMHNCMGDADPKERMARRADILSTELKLNRDRILSWTFAQFILFGWWCIEDHGNGWQTPLRLAEIVDELM